MKYLITEDQNKQLLKSMVKRMGWEYAANLVGGPETLAEIAFNNDPLEFLNLFNDLDVVQNESDFSYILYRYEKYENLMVYNKINGTVYVIYNVIWLFLEDGFGLKYGEIQKLTEEWLGETYNLRGITTEYATVAR